MYRLWRHIKEEIQNDMISTVRVWDTKDSNFLEQSPFPDKITDFWHWLDEWNEMLKVNDKDILRDACKSNNN